jgi:hypothetical protein
MQGGVEVIKKVLLSAGLLLGLAIPSWSQDVPGLQEYPKFEGFGGFSILSFGGQDDEDIDLDRNQFWGWQAGGAFNPSSVFGIAFDFGGQYDHFEVPIPGSDDEDDVFLQNYQFMAGPRLYARGERATGFGHFLIGGAHSGVEGFEDGDPEGTTGLGMAVGGGIDINFGAPGGAGLRLIQFDWLPQRFAGDWQNDTFRVGIGLVFQGPTY